MLIIPTQPLANQSFQCQLGGQATTLNIYQQAYGLYVDVYIGADLIIGGVIAENYNRIVRSQYLGYLGDFIFVDTQGNDDPVYTGLGSRYQLVYLEQSELPEEVG